jgi:uroporphyrinogen decarboxylase
MNDLEVFQDTLAHRRPERVLYHANFAPDLRRRVIEHIGTEDIAVHYGTFRPAMVMMSRPEGLPPLDYSPYWADEDLPEGTTINAMGVACVPSSSYHFSRYVSPLRNATSLSQIEEYPLDDMSDWDCSHMRPIVEQAHAEGRVVYGGIGHIYENAWQIRGYEPFLMDLLERPAWAQCLIDRLAAQKMAMALAFTEAGADLLNCGDDIASQKAMMFQPAVWRRMLLSRWRDVWQAAKAIRPDVAVFYHSDGNIFAVVGDLLDAGVDVLNPLQPECLDVDEVHRLYGHRVTFDGAIGTQSTMPWGTPADVRARVREIIDKYGRDGGLIISPTHVLEPEVPLANIDALMDACRRYGRLA